MRKKAGIIGAILIAIAAPAFVSSGIKEKQGRDAALKKSIAASSRMEVFSLRPLSADNATRTERRFHGHDVLGSTTLDSREEKAKPRISAIASAIEATLAEPEGAKGCIFTPRHGLRIKAGSGTIDLVICLECGDVEVGNKRFDLKGREGREKLRDALNAPLKDAGIELAKGAE